MSKASRLLTDLAEPATARAVLDSLKLELDGKAAAAETVRRKRRTLVNAANYAVDLGELRENPITAVRRQKPKVSNQVDPRVVANPEPARNLLTTVPSSTYYRVWQEVGDDSVKVDHGKPAPYARKSRAEAKRVARVLEHYCGFPVPVEPMLVFVGVTDLNVVATQLSVRVYREPEVAALAPLSGVLTAEQVERVYGVARHRQAWIRA
ncbi:hypothetical protein ACIPSJ_13675 [Streptomyces sp. NPDC090088]|uniref:hypothetical protein n=1 Tax=Streptomyces sp. NPDC090088 TaxID=3365944 RepID=UPI003807318B